MVLNGEAKLMEEQGEQSMIGHLSSLHMDLKPWVWQLRHSIQDRLPMPGWEVDTDWHQVGRSVCCSHDGVQPLWRTLFERGTSGDGTLDVAGCHPDPPGRSGTWQLRKHTLENLKKEISILLFDKKRLYH